MAMGCWRLDCEGTGRCQVGIRDQFFSSELRKYCGLLASSSSPLSILLEEPYLHKQVTFDHKSCPRSSIEPRKDFYVDFAEDV